VSNKQKLTGANTKSAALPERGIPSAESVQCSFLHNSNTEGNQPAPHVTYRTSGCAKLLAHPRQWEPSEHTALRSPQRSSCSGHGQGLPDNGSCPSQTVNNHVSTSVANQYQTYKTIHPFLRPITKEQSTPYVRIKRITATGIQGTQDTHDTRVLSQCDLRYP
jgi:hypothetical protein